MCEIHIDFSVSLAVCKAGAAHKGMPLYKYIAQLAGIQKVRQKRIILAKFTINRKIG